MSFSGEVKEELVKLECGTKNSQIAELAAMLIYADAVQNDDIGTIVLQFQADTPYIAKRSAMLISNIFNQKSAKNVENENYIRVNGIDIDYDVSVMEILNIIKYKKESNTVENSLMKSQSSRRAFLRGAFLATGSMSNPQKGYHLEFVCTMLEQAKQLIEILDLFDIRAKTVSRKKYQIVYIKESEEIVELLNVIGAHIALMNLENMRIFKGVRNSVNRKVNCETANIAKTVNAATKQIEDIQYIKEHYGFDNLPESLREIAQLRLEYPDATLKELGEYLTPNISKSGVNHRLRKLKEIKEQKG